MHLPRTVSILGTDALRAKCLESSPDGFSVIAVKSLCEARALAQTKEARVVLIDGEMVSHDLLADLVARIDRDWHAGALLVGSFARDETIALLRSGAADVQPRSIGERELQARLGALLARFAVPPAPLPTLRLDFALREVHTAAGRFRLHEAAFQLLWMLARTAPRALAPAAIETTLRLKTGVHFDVRALVREIRTKAGRSVIEAVAGTGYRLIADCDQLRSA